ncbi:phenazine-specific anthranilate synthase [Microbacterium hominis]|uniref:anthranilate synthase family protein n=1 Tax=Microbacterium TaxID=33882 RepID=UPI00168AA0C9|nr:MULTISPECIES: chorismate-binding protein [Microbacterium]QOC25983.1 phenazine-specific anthranilate synthase [Microbacterium hominis]QOC29957.1 phenazine-specific anthranilate synthase [Microbacterium hominis]QYF97645.1 chorismate-binding protein [Microbacterium sp. PAMC21962]
MTPSPALLESVLRADRPFALIARDPDTVELLVGDVVDVALLADIPLRDATGAPREVLALVPYRQVVERGFACHDDGAPLRCLVVEEHTTLPRADVLAALPTAAVPLADAGFDISDDEYAAIVRTVIADEIGRGEGANFVIRRDFTASVDTDALTAGLTWFRALLEHERGAYWTFLVSTPGHLAVGASPEAHVSAQAGAPTGPGHSTVTMNPISGTFRHPAGGATAETLTEFLSSTKETEELFMVVDEELKMMSAVCSDGGRITGPHLKEMSRLTHTEYMLRGTSTMDPRDILRETMFAPTVTGSPMQNACTVIQRHERAPRGYYSGVAALFTPTPGGGHDLDAPILIRTAYLVDGTLRVPVGATLVRHSDPDGEVGETHGKAAGVLGAIGAVARDVVAEASALDEDAPAARPPRLADVPEIAALLAARNERLASFWLEPQAGEIAGPYSGRTAVVVDAEDRFTTMLAHQLRHLGFAVSILPWNDADAATLAAADLVVAGPGPGDPRDDANARIRTMRAIVADRLESGRPLLAVCLSHQILADRLGISLAPLDAPHQGLQKTVDVFGVPASIGFYNTFTARVEPGTDEIGRTRIAADPASGDVYALRGPGYASVQGHLESILSRDGLRTLESLIADALS